MRKDILNAANDSELIWMIEKYAHKFPDDIIDDIHGIHVKSEFQRQFSCTQFLNKTV